MSRQTVTLTDYRGVKVRTSIGKRYYVVIADGENKAKVIKRTDSAVAVTRELTRWIDTVAYRLDFDLNGNPFGVELSDEAVVARANAEKRQIKARKTEIARWGH